MTHERHDPLLPTPEFARFLEWQLATELRRVERFGGATDGHGVRLGRLNGWRRLAAAAALAGVALTLGACGVLAVQGQEQRANAKVLRAQYQTRFEIARVREEVARAEVDRLRTLGEQGLVSAFELLEQEDTRLARALEASLLGLDTIEVGQTGHEPDRRLCAALVDGRDLVRERLDCELSTLRLRESAMAERAKAVTQLAEAGQMTGAEQTEADAAAAELAQRIEEVTAQIELRERYGRKEIDAARVELEALALHAEKRLAVAQGAELRARQSAEQLETLRKLGYISDAETLRMEAELREAQLRRQQVEAELSTLRQLGYGGR